MKAKVAFFLSSVLLWIVALGAVAQVKYIPKLDEELYGTWTNEQNVGDSLHPQKVVIKEGEFSSYLKISHKLPPETQKYWIDSKWTDTEGNIWYKIRAAGSGGSQNYKFQELYKLNKSATIMERMTSFWFDGEYDPSKYPTGIDPNDFVYYRILYRAAN